MLGWGEGDLILPKSLRQVLLQKSLRLILRWFNATVEPVMIDAGGISCFSRVPGRLLLRSCSYGCCGDYSVSRAILTNAGKSLQFLESLNDVKVVSWTAYDRCLGGKKISWTCFAVARRGMHILTRPY